MNLYRRAEAVLLALDPAKGKSGAALLRPDGHKTRLVTSAVVTRQEERETFVASARELAKLLTVPLIVVAEEWDPPRVSGGKRVDKNWNYPTILGIGEGWGRWTAEFERYGIPELDVVRVTPNVWRDALYGKQRVQDSDGLKKFAVNYVEQRMQQTLPHDAAEAVCLGLWGLHAPDVHRRIDVWARKNKRPA
jgi:hypothetical protein